MSVLLSSKLEKIQEGLLFWWCDACHTTHPIYLRRPERTGPSWDWDGDAWKPTFTPSFLLRYQQNGAEQVCHTWIREGKVIYLADSTHSLAGQTIDLPDIPDDEL